MRGFGFVKVIFNLNLRFSMSFRAQAKNLAEAKRKSKYAPYG